MAWRQTVAATTSVRTGHQRTQTTHRSSMATHRRDRENHYRAKRPDGSNRHLIACEGEDLYALLESHLQKIGYTGPNSAAEGSNEH